MSNSTEPTTTLAAPQRMKETVPVVSPPGTATLPKTNRIGLTLDPYKGAESTLCSGCGHDSITSQILKAYYELGVPPHTVAKLSGIGCSSKTPAYFLSKAHGFNAVHGRMPAVATGAKLANKHLNLIGISGDGDTASIGMGQYVHLVRRNLGMVYIIENNGVYGLTKGQFSATADMGSGSKKGDVNEMIPIDCCGLAIELGCTFVARSFSADLKQLLALLKIAIHHNGTAALAVATIERARRESLFLTGLLYLDKGRRSFTETCNMVDDPLATIAPERVRPSKASLDEIMNSLT